MICSDCGAKTTPGGYCVMCGRYNEVEPHIARRVDKELWEYVESLEQLVFDLITATEDYDPQSAVWIHTARAAKQAHRERLENL